MAKQISRVGQVSGVIFAGVKQWILAAVALSAAALLSGCEKGGVGDPCIPEDEYQKDFSGYSETEVNIESRSFQCETRVCLVNKFRGRVSCPYGNEKDMNNMGVDCKAPDDVAITAPVRAQLTDRPPSSSVYCSCRCAGATKDAPYCECPDGFKCEKLIDDIGLGNKELAGSYCVRSGTNGEVKPKGACNWGAKNCGAERNFFR